MAVAVQQARFLAVRGSAGLHLVDPFLPSDQQEEERLCSTKNCLTALFSKDGTRLAWVDGETVQVYDTVNNQILYRLNAPKTKYVRFSPKTTYLATWEPYGVTKETPVGACNLRIWKETDMVAEYVQKNYQDWCPQWSDNEELAARNVTNEIHCFAGGQLGKTVDSRLHVNGLGSFVLSPGQPPYHLAVFIKAYKGNPAFVRLYQYPNLSGVVANKSFFRGDKVTFHWNPRGTAVLALSSSDVDKTGGSYYGEQALHFLSTDGDGNMVQLDKKGPVYSISWSPLANLFCVIYGFMPSKTALFNHHCEMVFDFGTAHRNTVSYNPHGNILVFGGFGNLRGEMEFWNASERKLISKAMASDTTHLEWCPDGRHVVTATTAPRLRVDNGYKVWHFSGSQLSEVTVNSPSELWEVTWLPQVAGGYDTPDPTEVLLGQTHQKTPSKPSAVYRPPALRGKPQTFKLHEEAVPKEDVSKSAMKNRKKRDAKIKSKADTTLSHTTSSNRSEGQKAALSVAQHILGDQPSVQDTSGEAAKKMKNLRKKLKQIEELKKKQSEGQVLEANQVEKVETESMLIEELSKLEMGK